MKKFSVYCKTGCRQHIYFLEGDGLECGAPGLGGDLGCGDGPLPLGLLDRDNIQLFVHTFLKPTLKTFLSPLLMAFRTRQFVTIFMKYSAILANYMFVVNI